MLGIMLASPTVTGVKPPVAALSPLALAGGAVAPGALLTRPLETANPEERLYEGL